jgi:DNA-binding CsgD family transcriptional regulator
VPGPRNTISTPAPPEARLAAPEQRAGVRAVEELVRDLIDEVSVEQSFSGDEDAVLLDLEVDGVRCVLVVTRPETSHSVVLSPREQEIARMVAQGYPNKTIAAVLEISSWTVSTHLRRVFAKLGVRSRAAMVARLVGEHLLPEPEVRRR